MSLMVSPGSGINSFGARVPNENGLYGDPGGKSPDFELDQNFSISIGSFWT